MKMILYLVMVIGLPMLVTAQPKAKSPIKPEPFRLEKLVAGSGLPYKMVHDSLAVIPYTGEHVKEFDLVVQKASDLLLIYTNLSDALSGKLDSTAYPFLLQQNHHFDLVKIGMDESQTVFVRADVYLAATNVKLLTRMIKQVANVTNILGGILQ
ncbi:MAG: hypothetical protein KAF40_08695 [Flavihumibacter sp.]|nr:hypothetical protein [Flavihumibacter sp.]